MATATATATAVPARTHARWPALAVLVVPLLTFARAVPYPFTRSWDDGRFIIDNPDVLHPSWKALVRMFTTVQFEAYHPLHLLSYWLDVPWVNALAPGNLALMATLVHAVSLALWTGALLQCFQLLCELSVPPWAAALGTLAFGCHPAQVEAVSWASGRKDVLSLCFVVASLRQQLRAANAFDRHAWFSRALYGAALLSKTTALPLPLFGLLLDVLARKRGFRVSLLWQLPSLAIGLALSIVVFVIWRDSAMVRETLGDESQSLLRASQTLGHQLLTALWPSRVAPMYSTQSIGKLDVPRTAACVAYALACVLALRSRYKLSAVGLLGFAVWLVPASNIVPMYFPLQDRYLSLPLFSLGVGLSGLALPAAPPQHLRVWCALGVAAVALLCLRTVQYAGTWQSELRLWGHAVSAQPDADYAYLKLGEVRREAGDLEGAIAAYQGAIHIAPLRKLAHAGLFEVVARRDERLHGTVPSRARELALEYYKRLSNQQALHAFPAQLWSMGYKRAAELPLHALLVVEEVPQSAIAQSAVAALRAGRVGLARFYVHALREPPKQEPLSSLYAEPYFRVVP